MLQHQKKVAGTVLYITNFSVPLRETMLAYELQHYLSNRGDTKVAILKVAKESSVVSS
jgi:hypothetical protein